MMMVENFLRISKLLSRLGGALLLLLSGFPWHAHAAAIPNFDQPVVIIAREQNASQFIEELFGQIQVPVVVSAGINNAVDGHFDGTAQDIFNDMAKSLQITLYYDGAVAFVYPAKNVTRRFALYVQ